jgi:hypothetical protein
MELKQIKGSLSKWGKTLNSQNHKKHMWCVSNKHQVILKPIPHTHNRDSQTQLTSLWPPNVIPQIHNRDSQTQWKTK